MQERAFNNEVPGHYIGHDVYRWTVCAMEEGSFICRLDALDALGLH